MLAAVVADVVALKSEPVERVAAGVVLALELAEFRLGGDELGLEPRLLFGRVSGLAAELGGKLGELPLLLDRGHRLGESALCANDR